MRLGGLQLEKKRKADQIAATGSASGSGSRVAGSSAMQARVPDLMLKFDKEGKDDAVADFFYANGVAFNVARSPQYSGMFAKVAPAYKPPTSEDLRGKLLVKVS